MFKNKRMVSNQYFRFDRIIDNDNVVIISSDLRFVKGQGVLVTANNKAVYLKPWQVQAVTNWEILGPRYLIFIRRLPELYEFRCTDDNEIYYLTKNEVERLTKN